MKKDDFEDEDEGDEVKQEIAIPKYTTLYEDLEVELKPDMTPEEREELREKEEEEKKKKEENKNEEGELEVKLSNKDKIVKYIGELLQETKDKKPLSDKDLACKLKEKLDSDIDLIQPSVSNEEIEESGVWQVIVGKQFAATVTYDSKYIYYFQLDESRKYFLCFRS